MDIEGGLQHGTHRGDILEHLYNVDIHMSGLTGEMVLISHTVTPAHPDMKPHSNYTSLVS